MGIYSLMLLSAICCFDLIQILMSTQPLKQLKIKTSMLKRLRKEYESYQKESEAIQTKLQQYEAALNTCQDEQTETAIRKNRQFLMESNSVLSNVKQKLIEAFQGLAQFLSQKGQCEELVQTEEKKQAENLVLEVETFLENTE